jgi:hypothetical protein
MLPLLKKFKLKFVVNMQSLRSKAFDRRCSKESSPAQMMENVRRVNYYFTGLRYCSYGLLQM